MSVLLSGLNNSRRIWNFTGISHTRRWLKTKTFDNFVKIKKNKKTLRKSTPTLTFVIDRRGTFFNYYCFNKDFWHYGSLNQEPQKVDLLTVDSGLKEVRTVIVEKASSREFIPQTRTVALTSVISNPTCLFYIPLPFQFPIARYFVINLKELSNLSFSTPYLRKNIYLVKFLNIQIYSQSYYEWQPYFQTNDFNQGSKQS